MKIESLISQYERDAAAARDREQRARQECESILSAAKSEGRSSLMESEDQRCEELFSRIERAKTDAAKAEENLSRLRAAKAEDDEYVRLSQQTHKTNAGLSYGAGGSYESDESRDSGWIDPASGRQAAIGRNQSFADHHVVRDEMARTAERDRIIIGTHGSLPQQIRALSTTNASAIVPTIWSSDIIDKVRNQAVCLKAGVTVVPMPAKVYQIGRLNADVAPAFKNEGSAIAVSDPGFDFVQLTATSLACLTVASLEFLADAPNADTVLQEAIAKAMALELDKAILFGGLLTADGSEGYNLPAPYPRGVLKTLLTLASGNVLGGTANGTTQTATSYFRELQNLVFSVKRRNEVPGALVSNDALVQKYVDAYDTQNRPLEMPSNLKALPWLTTNAINSATQGTGTNMTDVFNGDWSQVLLGQRLGLEIRVLSERYAELGQVGILAYWRGDVQLARLSAMGVYRYIQASA